MSIKLAGKSCPWAVLGWLAGISGCTPDRASADARMSTESSRPDLDAAEAPAWELVEDALPAALFSVWGSGANDIWTVGADPGDGPLVVHYDGQHWERKATGIRGTLWWVSGLGDSVWMSGDQGTVLRYSKTKDDFEVFTLPGDVDNVTIYGVFPTSADEVWAVGGRLLPAKGSVYRFDGEAWKVEDELPSSPDEEPFFKVWGRSATDLWVVGFYGERALHRTESGWQNVPLDVPSPRPMFTIHGNQDTVVAVGGQTSGVAVELDGDQLVDISDPTMFRLNGVHVQDNGDILTAGFAGAIYTRHDNKWTTQDAPITPWGYHGVFVDSDGGQWAVGGQIDTEPYEAGILAHRGEAVSHIVLDVSVENKNPSATNTSVDAGARDFDGGQ